MTRARLYGSIPAVAITAAGVLQSGNALAATKTHAYKGTIEEMGRHGPIQVTIKVRSKQISSVSVAVAPEGPRSQFIVARALPLLKAETLQAQSANVDTISGATDTSDGYIQSLQAAVAKARKAKQLK